MEIQTNWRIKNISDQRHISCFDDSISKIHSPFHIISALESWYQQQMKSICIKKQKTNPPQATDDANNNNRFFFLIL